MPSAHPMFLGHDIGEALDGVDVIVIVDSDIPWIEAAHRPADGTRIIHVGPDPHFIRMPIRGFRTDLAIQSDPVSFVSALAQEMKQSPDTNQRKNEIAAKNIARREAARVKADQGCASPMSSEWLSQCLSDVIDEDTIMFTELGILPAMMELGGPNRVFSNPHSGGLGWAIPAALGGQLAARDRLCVACVGDGSYIFSNPVACHQIAQALELPILTIIKNNGMWNAVRRATVNAYPQGAASKSNVMPLTSLDPAPDYLKVAEASGAYTERVIHGEDLPAALDRAVQIIMQERRQVLLDVHVEVSDTY
jgi:acetolactate synthase-1/2/3 large subunit